MLHRGAEHNQFYICIHLYISFSLSNQTLLHLILNKVDLTAQIDAAYLEGLLKELESEKFIAAGSADGLPLQWARFFPLLRVHTEALPAVPLVPEALAFSVVDEELQIKYRTIVQQVIAQKKREALLQEEKRILYVAMTRARERLYLIGSCGEPEKRGQMMGKDAEIPAGHLGN